MQKLSRARGFIAVALIASAGLVAAGSTFASSSGSAKKAGDADTLNGLRAGDLVRTFYTRDDSYLAGFNPQPDCALDTVLQQRVEAPVAGTISVTATALVAHHGSPRDVGWVLAQLFTPAGAISPFHEQTTRFVDSPSNDSSTMTLLGNASVPQGTTVVQLKMTECSGSGPIVTLGPRVISTTFTPFGSSSNVTPGKAPSHKRPTAAILGHGGR